jgi:hypothetical protein
MTAAKLAKRVEDHYRAAFITRGVPINMTPDEIEAWVEVNVTNLATAKEAIKRMAIDVAGLKRCLRRLLADRKLD